jgi:hypothetical protein
MTNQPVHQPVDTATYLSDLVDEFCYQVACSLRRVLNLEEEEPDDETADD